MALFIHVPPLGIGNEKYGDGFTYRGDRPARHCGICGDSYQPELARSPEYNTSQEVRYKVEILLQDWAYNHNKKHSIRQHLDYQKRGNLLTPEAAVRLIPLGIYPLQDMVMDEEVAQAGLEAKRAPSNDVPTY